MNIEQLRKNIKSLSGSKQTEKFNSFKKIEEDIESFLNAEPGNIEVWLRLAILQLRTNLNDLEKCEFCLRKVLFYDNNNMDALILLAFVQLWCLGGLDKEIKEKLMALECSDCEVMSMKYYILAWHYYDDDIRKAEEMFLKSIEKYSYHVNNYADLGMLYINMNESEKGKKFISIAINNVKCICDTSNSDDEVYDVTNLDDYINERIKGVYMEKGNYLSLKEKL